MSAEIYECRDWKFRFNDLVVVEAVIAPDEDRIGRLVQVQKGVGAFGSDVSLIRRRDGSLMSFHNVMLRPAGDESFENACYRLNGRTPPEVRPAIEYPMDEPGEEYSIAERYPEIGFVIEHPSQPGNPQQAFAMRITTPAK